MVKFQNCASFFFLLSTESVRGNRDDALGLENKGSLLVNGNKISMVCITVMRDRDENLGLE